MGNIITLGKIHVFSLIITAVVLTGIHITLAQTPSTLGHNWTDIDCDSCVVESNIDDGAIVDGKIVSVEWSKLTGVPSDIDDGDDDDIMGCVSTKAMSQHYTTSCGGNCCPFNYYCPSGCSRSRTDFLTFACSNNQVESITYNSGSWGNCVCGGTCEFSPI